MKPTINILDILFSIRRYKLSRQLLPDNQAAEKVFYLSEDFRAMLILSATINHKGAFTPLELVNLTDEFLKNKKMLIEGQQLSAVAVQVAFDRWLTLRPIKK